MHITVLGTRDNIRPSASKHSRHSGIPVDDEILLDFGKAAYLEYQPRCIFVTHLHPDHAVFMQTNIRPSADVDFYVPESTKRMLGAHAIAAPVRVRSYRVIPVTDLRRPEQASVVLL